VAEAGNALLFALADGLGGHRGGGEAARLAVQSALALFRALPSLDGEAMRSILDAAHQTVVEGAPSGDPAGRGVGGRTTLVLLAVEGESARWIHVGDSRLYHFRGGAVCSRTRDHSVPEILFRAGDIEEKDIRGHRDRSRLLQALGGEVAPRPTLSDPVRLHPGDALLLCSDGWWEPLDEGAMLAALHASGGDPEVWIGRMLARLPEEGPLRDNFSALAVVVG